MIYFWDELELEEWFCQHFKLLGFEKIGLSSKYGDYLAWRDGRVYTVELERTVSQFFLHKPDVREKMDIIVCWKASTPRSICRRMELTRKEIYEVRSFIPDSEILKRPEFADIKKMGQSLYKNKKEVVAA